MQMWSGTSGFVALFVKGRYSMNSSTEFESYFHVIRDIIGAMHSLTSLQDVIDVVVTKTARVLNAKGALLRILNKETNQFEVRAASGLGERYLTKGPVTTETILSTLSEPGEVYIITDIWNAPRIEYPQEAWDEGIRMLLDVPLAIDEHMTGLLRIYLSEQRELSDDELDFIKTVAMQCACVIERVGLIENQQSRFDHLATRVEKGSSLGRMAAGIAHEINNPLAGILLYSSNLSKKVPKGGPLEEGLKIIIKETQRCKTIIQGLLDFAREQEPERFLVSVNGIMTSAIGIVENEFHLRQVRIRKELAEHMAETLLDINQIEQVFINLLLNALHAVDDGGLITVKSGVNEEQRKVHIEIADNGCGIAAENMEKIFEPFFSTRANGTGLGLSVSYGIVKNHQGDIRVFSEPGQGTRMIIEFPILVDQFAGKEGP
ncbi:MAG: GAF domain-containing protein [Deltaproteobacteria bacterium]|nr:GAF domain-containing protein [Deltaproteobacteria bacterium]